MANHRSKLHCLVPGDILHAECPNGASLICLVEAITNGKIEARRVTTQDHVSFDLETGHTADDDEVRCTIDSIMPLPVDIHNVLLGLDRKMRLCTGDAFRLSQQEKDALKFLEDFYPAHPIDEERAAE